MKIILDSNVIIAAFAGRGLCNALFELCLDRYDIFVSDNILSEVHENLCEKLNLPEKNADMIISYFKEFCLIRRYARLKRRVCRDKDDDEILGLAKGIKAQHIITGDNDLLSLKNYDATEIISPRQFWEIAKNK